MFRRGRIVGDIVPNATGPGGWVTFLDGIFDDMPKLQWAHTRPEARAMFEVDPMVPEGELR